MHTPVATSPRLTKRNTAIMRKQIQNLPVVHLAAFAEIEEKRPMLLVTSLTTSHWDDLLQPIRRATTTPCEVVYAVGGRLVADAVKYAAAHLGLPLCKLILTVNNGPWRLARRPTLVVPIVPSRCRLAHESAPCRWSIRWVCVHRPPCRKQSWLSIKHR